MQDRDQPSLAAMVAVVVIALAVFPVSWLMDKRNKVKVPDLKKEVWRWILKKQK